MPNRRPRLRSGNVIKRSGFDGEYGVKNLPLGTAYAVWTGIGTIGTVILGIIMFKEPVSVLRLFCIALIFSGIVGLKLLTH